jgi:hypothetical protein
MDPGAPLALEPGNLKHRNCEIPFVWLLGITGFDGVFGKSNRPMSTNKQNQNSTGKTRISTRITISK